MYDQITTNVLNQLGVINPETGKRLDAAQTAFLINELRHVKAQTYDVLYAPRKFREFIPTDATANPGAETITYRQYDVWGMAKVVHDYAGDLPMVGVAKKEFISTVKSFGVAYNWSIQDLRAAAMAGVPLNTMKARMAREACENFHEVAATVGIPDMNTTGFLNNANVPVGTFPNAGAWSGLTSAQILANLFYMETTIVQQSKETILPDSLILAPTEFDVLKTPYNVNDSRTILQIFLQNAVYIKNVDRWQKLTAAGASSKNRCVAYKRDPMVLCYNEPVNFEELPPQAKNLSFMVPCHARAGVVEVHYPLGMLYTDV